MNKKQELFLTIEATLATVIFTAVLVLLGGVPLALVLESLGITVGVVMAIFGTIWILEKLE